MNHSHQPIIRRWGLWVCIAALAFSAGCQTSSPTARVNDDPYVNVCMYWDVSGPESAKRQVELAVQPLDLLNIKNGDVVRRILRKAGITDFLEFGDLFEVYLAVRQSQVATAVRALLDATELRGREVYVMLWVSPDSVKMTPTGIMVEAVAALPEERRRFSPTPYARLPLISDSRKDAQH